jgi:D-alanyl-D-alanine carboxypeptidase
MNMLLTFNTSFFSRISGRGAKRFPIVLLYTIFLVALILAIGGSHAEAAAKKKNSSNPSPNLKYASIVIDADTGMVLSQDNADRSLHPASLTKIMTMVLVFDALESQKISQNSRLVASSFSTSMPPSKLGLKPRETIRVYDALRVLATKSANDVAVIVAENLGGSEARFSQMMNLKARDIGMTGTRFVNASGLHDYRQVSTARDMAKLAKYLIDTYPKYYPIFGIKHYKYEGKVLHNHNRLMNTYQGMDGIKTGYVAASGFNLVASAKRGNTRLVGVVFGGRTTASRNAHMADLLDRGFKRIAEIRTAGYAGTNKLAHVTPLSSPNPQPLPPKKPLLYAARPLKTQEIQNKSPQIASSMKTLQVSPLPNADSVPAPIDNRVEDSSTSWQIQIGAFGDRAATNKALYDAMMKLPKHLNKGKTLVVPLRTEDAQWVFRARLSGYTRSEAIEACNHIKTAAKDCLPIAPQTH